MMGRQWTTISPSSTSSSRSTPCVDGCCGPMLIVISSRSSAAGTELVVRSVSAIHLSGYREIDGLAAERLGASERVALPVVGQHDPLQIRVALKLDTKQVE